MNLSKRSKLSLCQFLILFERGEPVTLLDKYDFFEDEWEYQNVSQYETQDELARQLRKVVLRASPEQLGNLLEEMARTQDSLRSLVTPRYRFDERWDDLLTCLQMDGYVLKTEYKGGVQCNTFVPIDPAIEGAEPVENDLARELRASGLSEAEKIIRTLENSADAFRRADPDFNACLANARVALQTLATSIATVRTTSHPGKFDPTKWGQVVAYLRTSGFISEAEEKGLGGVFGFISPGAHTPIGLTEQELARLGRSLAASMCYFMVKKFNGQQT